MKELLTDPAAWRIGHGFRRASAAWTLVVADRFASMGGTAYDCGNTMHVGVVKGSERATSRSERMVSTREKMRISPVADDDRCGQL